LSLVGVTVIVFALYWLFDAPIFRVNRILVAGNVTLEPEAVGEAINARGHNIFKLNNQEMVNNALSLAQVQRAEVITRLPSTVVVRIYERPAAYTWRSGDISYQVAMDGVVLAEGDSSINRVTIFDKSERPLRPGDRLGEEMLKSAERLTNWLPSQTGLQVERFEFSPAEGLVVVTKEDYRVLFGAAENLGARLVTLQTVLEQMAKEGRNASIIDLRSDGRPFVR
jgi:cell division septal protein FtsQ